MQRYGLPSTTGTTRHRARSKTYELAEKLDIPGSTLSYRLRRAEAHLAEAYVADRSTSPHLSSPDT